MFNSTISNLNSTILANVTSASNVTSEIHMEIKRVGNLTDAPFYFDVTNLEPRENVQPKKKMRYTVKGDGTCFFRAYLAYENKDASWLKNKSIQDVYVWMNEHRFFFHTAIDQSIASLMLTFNNNDTENSIIESMSAINQKRLLANELLDGMMADNHFMLWRLDLVSAFFQDHYGVKLPEEMIENLIEGIYQSLSEQLHAPTNQNKNIYLKRTTGRNRKEYHYELVGPEGLFSKNIENTQNLYEDNIYKPKDDGASYIRAYLATINNNTLWLRGKSLGEIYLWVHQKREIFQEVISNSVDALNLKSMFNDNHVHALEYFSSPCFLDEMMGKEEFKLFNTFEIIKYANKNNILITEETARHYVTKVIHSLMEKLGVREGYNGEYYINDDFYIVKSDLDSHSFLIGKNTKLSGNERPSRSISSSPALFNQQPYLNDESLSQFKWVNHKGQSFYVSWLSLINKCPESISPSDIGLAIKNTRSFQSHLVTAIISVLKRRNCLISRRDSFHLCKYIIDKHFIKGNFDLDLIFNFLLRDPHELNALLIEKLRMNKILFFNIKEEIEAELIKRFHFLLVDESDIGLKRKETEFFVKDVKGHYSIVALKNHFGSISNKDYSELDAYLEENLGKQNKRLKADLDAKSIFNKKDSITAAVSLFVMASNSFNQVAKDNGYNLSPVVSRNRFEHRENAESTEVTKYEKENIGENKTGKIESILDFKDNKSIEEKNGEKLKRVKRRFPENFITPIEIMSLRIEHLNLGIEAHEISGIIKTLNMPLVKTENNKDAL